MAKYPKNEDTVRPYRLWHTERKKDLPHRYYSHIRSAHIGALIEAKWELKPGEALEVYNTHHARLIQQYVRSVESILVPKEPMTERQIAKLAEDAE